MDFPSCNYKHQLVLKSRAPASSLQHKYWCRNAPVLLQPRASSQAGIVQQHNKQHTQQAANKEGLGGLSAVPSSTSEDLGRSGDNVLVLEAEIYMVLTAMP